MKRNSGGIIWLFCSLLLCCIAHGQLAVGVGPRTLVKIADLVVVGKLSDIEECEFTLTYNKPKTAYFIKHEMYNIVPKPFTRHFDVGIIKNPKVLKGHISGDDSKAWKWIRQNQKLLHGDDFEYVRVAFDSPRDAIATNYTCFKSQSSGQEGVWFLMRDDYLTGCYHVIKPYSPYPLDSEAEVTNALKEIESE